MGKKRYRFIDCVHIVGKACPEFNGYKRYVSTGALKIDTVDFDKTELVSYKSKPSRANLIVKNGNILFAKMLGTKKTFKIDNESSEYIFSTGFCAVEPNDKLLNAECLYYILCSDLFLKQKDKYCSGATQKAITNQGLEKIYISIPDIKNQKNISKKLDKIIKIIRMRERQLVELDTLIKARFVEMFGDISTNRYGYKTKKLGKVANVGSSHRVFTTEFVKEGIPFYRGKEISELSNGNKPTETYYISEEHYNRLVNDDTKPQVGDLLMPSICNKGQIWMVNTDEPFYYKDGRVLCISPNRQIFNTKYLEYYMRFKTLVEYPKLGSGSTFAEFKIFLLKDIDVLVPPLELQNEFASFVAQIDKLKFGCCQIIDKSKNIKTLIINTITLGRRILYGK